jgi:hypothetical protein
MPSTVGTLFARKRPNRSMVERLIRAVYGRD